MFLFQPSNFHYVIILAVPSFEVWTWALRSLQPEFTTHATRHLTHTGVARP